MRKFCVPFLLALSMALTASSCAQKSKKKAAVKDLPDSVTVLPLHGFNRDPQWISAEELLFHSSQRERHANFQLYRFKLGETGDKRVTYQDGDTDSAIFVPEEKAIYYSSSTDEVKELSDLVERFQNQESSTYPLLSPALTLYPTEIYRSNLDGGHITRLTHNKGFDGQIGYNPETKRLLFSSMKGDLLQLFSISTEGRKLRQLTTTPNHSVDFSYSDKAGRYIWIERPEKGPSEVWTADKRFRHRKDLGLPQGRYQSARFAAGENLLLSAQIDGVSKGYDLYYYNHEKACLISLLHAKGDQLSPTLSPDSQQIAFVHQANSTSQIALKAFEEPSAPCLGQPE